MQVKSNRRSFGAPSVARGSATASRSLSGPLPVVGGRGWTQGGSREPARRPAGAIMVLVADPGQPVGDGPLIDARLAGDAVEGVRGLLVGRQDGHAGALHDGSRRDG